MMIRERHRYQAWKYIYISWRRICFIKSFALPEMELGGTLIFTGIYPSGYYNFYDPYCGDSRKEIDLLRKKYDLDFFRFVNNIISYSTQRRARIYPHFGQERCICLPFSSLRESKEFTLDIVNIDEYWYKLSADEIKKLIRKSKRRWYD